MEALEKLLHARYVNGGGKISRGMSETRRWEKYGLAILHDLAAYTDVFRLLVERRRREERLTRHEVDALLNTFERMTTPVTHCDRKRRKVRMPVEEPSPEPR